MRASLLCEWEDCDQRSFDERFEGIDRGGASSRALAFFADLARGRATRAVGRDLGVPEHRLRLAVGRKRDAAHLRHRGRLGPHLAIDECSVRKNFVYATVFSDPARGVVIDMAPGRDASAVRVLFPTALIVADAFHLHRRVLSALTQVRRDAWNRWRARSRRLGKPFKDARFALGRSRESLEADTRPAGERQRMAAFDATNWIPTWAWPTSSRMRSAWPWPSGAPVTPPPSPPAWTCSMPSVARRASSFRCGGQDLPGLADRDRQLRHQRRGIERLC